MKPRKITTEWKSKSILDKDFYDRKVMVDSDSLVYFLKYDGNGNYSAFREDGITLIANNISFEYILNNMKQKHS